MIADDPGSLLLNVYELFRVGPIGTGFPTGHVLINLFDISLLSTAQFRPNYYFYVVIFYIND